MLNRCKKILIYFVCFVVLMISPAFAEQIGSSIPSSTINANPTDSRNILNGSKINNNNNIPKNIDNVPNTLKKNNSQLKTTKKTIKNTKSKQYIESSNQNQYSDIINHANELLPVMEESYENSTDEIVKTQETLENLQNRKIEATNHANQIKGELDNFEISTNNSGAYKKLQNEYKEYNDLKEEIKQTSESISDLKEVLKEKQNHTKNCVTALNQIKRSTNIPKAVETYNSNINSLGVISNKLAAQVQNNTDKIIISNDTANNNDTNNTNDTNLNINGESGTVPNLLISGIVIGSVGITVMGSSTLCVMGIVAASTIAKISGDGLIIGSSALIGSAIAGTIAFVVLLVGLACLIAYAGYKARWWNL